MNTTVDIYEKYKKPIDELTKINPELGNFYKLEFLKKEAKKRGYKDKKIILIRGLLDGQISRGTIGDDFDYFPDENKLNIISKGSDYTVFDNGRWAEIIKEKILSKAEAEAKLTELSKDGFEYKIIEPIITYPKSDGINL